MDVGFSFGKFITGAIISAGLAVGGVWTVVALSLTGMTSAIQATNDGITRLDNRLTAIEQRFDARMATMEVRMDNLVIQVGNGFKETKTELQKKASLDERLLPFAQLKQNRAVAVSEAIKDVTVTDAERSGRPRMVFLPEAGYLDDSLLATTWAAVNLEEPEAVKTFAKSFAFDGSFTFDELVKAAEKDGQQFKLSAEDGAVYSFDVTSGKLVIGDAVGNKAEVVDSGSRLGSVNLYKVRPLPTLTPPDETPQAFACNNTLLGFACRAPMIQKVE